MTDTSAPSPSPIDDLVDLAASSGSPEAATTYALAAVFDAWRDLHGGDEGTEAAPFANRALWNWAEVTPAVRRQLDGAVSELFTATSPGAPSAATTSVASAVFEALLAGREQTTSAAAAQSISSRTLNSLIGALARPGETAFDPACGYGGTLEAIAPIVSKIYGADTDPQAVEITRMRLALSGVTNPVIEVRDSLADPPSRALDLVVCHPPMGLHLDTDEVSGRLVEQLKPKGSMVDGNALWLSLVADSVAPDGLGLVVVPPASLSDRAQMRTVRSQILEQGRLQAIVALPLGVLPKSDVAPFLWVLSGTADPRKKGQVLLITATAESTEDWDEDDLASIEDLVRSWVYDAVAAEAPSWQAVLVDGSELDAKGFAPQIHLSAPPRRHRVRPLAPGRLITELRLHNFKSVGSPIALPLRPLTLLYGKNSAGKSSLIQSLMLLKQSLLAGGFTAAGDTVDLGSLAGLLHRHDLTAPMDVGISFASAPPLDADLALPNPQELRHYEARFTYPLTQDTGMPQALTLGVGSERFDFALAAADYFLPLEGFKRATELLSASGTFYGLEETGGLPRAEEAFDGIAEAAFPNVRFRADGLTVGALDPKFRREVAYRTAGSAFQMWGKEALDRCATLFQSLSSETVNLAERMVYLGPLRRAPERFSHRTPVASGFDMPFFLLENPSERAAVSDALARLKIPYTLNVVNPIDPKHRETLGDIASLVLTDTRSGVEVTPADVGFGISQVLPIVTELSARTSSVIMIEQPEIHLHPAMQAELADLFIGAVDPNRGANQVIAETHSEVLIMRIQKRIREEVLSPSDVLLLYVDQDSEGSASISELRIDEHGDFLDHWPGGFFDEQFNEIFGDF